jgi:hypothetical protein
MRHRLACFAGLLALCAMCFRASLAAGLQISSFETEGQTGGSSPAAAGPYTLNGIVVDSVTGAPIRRALVQLVGLTRGALTGEDGKFHFENLPQIQTNVAAMKPGYSDPSGRRREYAPVAIGGDTPFLTIKLEPQSAITVEVTSDEGDSVEALPVRLASTRVDEGRRSWEVPAAGNTDENGRFRAGDLLPGKYYVSVGPSFRPIGMRAPGADGSVSDVGYPRVFYPNAAELEGAAPIEITPGKHLRVEISVTSGPLYRISGTVVGGPIGQPCAAQLLDDSGEAMAIGVRVNPRTGEFSTGEMPAGLYTLRAFYPSSGRNMIVGNVPLRVDSNITNVTVAVAPTVEIPVVFRYEATEPRDVNSFPAILMLTRKEESSAAPNQVITADQDEGGSRMFVPGLEPGAYDVGILQTAAPFYVESVRSGSVDILEDGLIVPQGGAADPIEVTVRDDGASLTGSVRQNGAYVDATVLLVPDRNPKLVRKVQEAGGAFQAHDVAPGDYRVIAFGNAESLEYTNPEALKPYLAKAQDVTLGPRQQARIDLELARVEK